MKPNLYTYCTLAVVVCLHLSTYAQVSGKVFRDFNANGILNTTVSYNEPAVSGITVVATLSNGSIFTTSTNDSGKYSFSAAQIPAGTPSRIVFSGLKLGDAPSITGSQHFSNVQFVVAPDTTAHFAINAPDDYWDNLNDPNPALMVVQHPRGTYNGYNAGRFSVVHLQNNTKDPYAPPSAYVVLIDTSKRPARFFNTGTIFGLAVQRKLQRIFVSASLKRTFGLGTKGAGGIYFMNKSGNTWSYTGGFTLQNVIPSNQTQPLDFGTVIRVTTPDTDDNYISGSSSATSKSRDNDAFSKVGTMAIGGLDSDPNTDSIYLINLFQKNLVVLNGSLSNTFLSTANAAALSTHVKSYTLESILGYPLPSGTGNTLRPYAIRVYKGRGYIGVVNDAMATQQLNDLKGYILSFDLKNIAAGFTTEVLIQFNNYQGNAGRMFRPWVSNWTEAGGTATVTPKFCPQPMISDIEFNEDGSMDIAIRDRWGDQNAVDYNAWPSATVSGQTIQQGEILHACRVGEAWLLEGTAGSCVQPIVQGNPRTAPFNPGGFGNSYGKTSREFYADVSGDGENESVEGAIAKLMGTQQIVNTAYDPIEDGVEPSGNYWNTQGIHWNNCISGKKVQAARTAVSATIQVAKANGMGDIEFVTTSQPLQVGNLVWNDTNNNGLQDAGEKGIAGIEVQLRSAGIDEVFDNTDDQIWTTTTNATGNYYFDYSNMPAADLRKPTNWLGVKGILQGYNYRIEIDTTQTTLLGFQLVPSNVASNNFDDVDNDAMPITHRAIIPINTNAVNHNFDFGFKNFTGVGNWVWSDINSDGIQGAGEWGLPWIKVYLYAPNGILLDSMFTDANGYYLFTGLKPDNGYRIRFAISEGAQFTVPLMNGNVTNNSKADEAGYSPFFNLIATQQLLTIDAGVRTLETILPIHLLEFNAQLVQPNVQLTWKIDNRSASTKFIVQYAFNGNAFVNIDTQYAQHSTSFSYLHHCLAAGNYTYRLMIVEPGFQTYYSATRFIQYENRNTIFVYPNPANQWIYLQGLIAAPNKSISIHLFNNSGQLVFMQNLSSGATQIPVPVKNFPNGWYILKYTEDKGQSKRFKILIKH
ncbi:MAG: SdrD B-like domain-containing protein [Ferruginibacter sp.]